MIISDKGLFVLNKKSIFIQNFGDVNIKNAEISKIEIHKRKIKFSPKIFFSYIDVYGHDVYEGSQQKIKTIDLFEWDDGYGTNVVAAIHHIFGDRVHIVDRNHRLDIEDLGQKAGFFAYSALALFVVYLILLFIDDYTTLAWGYYYIFPFSIMAVMFFWSFLIIKKTCHNIGVSVLISGMFTVFATLAINQAVMNIAGMVGSKNSTNFKMISHHQSYEKWQNTEGFIIECILTPRPIYTEKNAQISYFITGMVRMKYTEICIPQDKLKQDQLQKQVFSDSTLNGR